MANEQEKRSQPEEQEMPLSDGETVEALVTGSLAGAALAATGNAGLLFYTTALAALAAAVLIRRRSREPGRPVEESRKLNRIATRINVMVMASSALSLVATIILRLTS